MTQNCGKRLKEYTASAINTGGEVYKKIIASEDAIAENQGAIERQLNDLFEFLDYYRESDIFMHEGKHLLKGLNFFSGLKRHPTENLKQSYAEKYKAMMIRHKPELDPVWGTKWNIEHALRYFFNHDNCFVMEFTNDIKTSQLSNEFVKDKWTLDGVAIDTSTNLTEEAALINIKAVRLGENMQLKTKTSVQLSEGLYSLHFFMRGQKYKDDKRVGMLELVIGNVFKKRYECKDMWENKQEYIYLSAGNYDFSFTGIQASDVDFICLFPTVKYPSMSILIGNGGLLGKSLMFFAPGQKDVQVDTTGNVTNYFEPPYKGTHWKYKFWFPHADDTEDDAKKDRKKKGIKFDDPQWGYWADDMRWLDVAYINILLDALIPVGVKVFDVITSRRGA